MKKIRKTFSGVGETVKNGLNLVSQPGVATGSLITAGVITILGWPTAIASFFAGIVPKMLNNAAQKTQVKEEKSKRQLGVQATKNLGIAMSTIKSSLEREETVKKAHERTQMHTYTTHTLITGAILFSGLYIISLGMTHLESKSSEQNSFNTFFPAVITVFGAFMVLTAIVLFIHSYFYKGSNSIQGSVVLSYVNTTDGIMREYLKENLKLTFSGKSEKVEEIPDSIQSQTTSKMK